MQQINHMACLLSETRRVRLLCVFASSLVISQAALAQSQPTPVNFVSTQASKDAPSALLPFAPTDAAGDTKFVQNTTAPQSQPQTADEAIPAQSGKESVPVESMPSVLTSPVLENVPTSLDKSQMNDPAEATTDPAANAVPSQSVSSEALQQGNGETNIKRAQSSNGGKLAGPRLRKRDSVLLTEQRPFLLYAQDASISYLMPNALVEHPWISRALRNTLENRALNKWQSLRDARNQSKDDPQITDRPNLVISGRVEDRFSSDDFSSLYLAETTSEGDAQKPTQVLSFNFDHRSNRAFGLRDLFKHQDEQALQATISLIAAYMQADIVRQKSVRLGTPVSIDQDSWMKDLEPDLGLLNTFTLVPSKTTGKIAGLTFHFNPGLLGAESDGIYAVYVPAAIFNGALDSAFEGMFEGEAMQVSRHNAAGFSTASVNLDGWREGMELGGDMLIEGEVPGSWCDGFHLTLVDKKSGQIVTEALVEMLPTLPPYGLAGNMMRFRAELPVSGSGGQAGQLIFEPYNVEATDGRILLRPQSACDPNATMTQPDTARDSVAISVIY